MNGFLFEGRVWVARLRGPEARKLPLLLHTTVWYTTLHHIAYHSAPHSMDQNDRSTFLGITYFRTCCIPPTNQRPEWLHSRCDSTFGIKWEPSYYLDGEICQTFRDVKLAPKVWHKLGICRASWRFHAECDQDMTMRCIALRSWVLADWQPALRNHCCPHLAHKVPLQ